MPESYTRINELKILQLEKEKLVDIRSRLSQERITPEEESTCLAELEKTSWRWASSTKVESARLTDMSIEKFLDFIKDVRPQIKIEDRREVVVRVDGRIKEINDRLFDLEYEAKPDRDAPEKQPLSFTYNQQSKKLSLDGSIHRGMKLSKKRADLLKSLKKPKNIRWLLVHLYSEAVGRNEKIIDNKRNSHDVFVSAFNRDWRKHFEFNKNLKLIQCENEIVSITQKIEWK